MMCARQKDVPKTSEYKCVSVCVCIYSVTAAVLLIPSTFTHRLYAVVSTPKKEKSDLLYIIQAYPSLTRVILPRKIQQVDILWKALRCLYRPGIKSVYRLPLK